MFTFGGFDATQLEGLSAVLGVWPGMAEVTAQTVAAPGADGVFYADATLGPGRWVFDLYARGVDPAEVLEIAEVTSGALAPHGGLRDLEVDVAPGWVWRVNTDSPIEWERGRWRPGSECYLSASVEFLAADPYGYAVPGDSWQWTTAGVREVTREHGNVESRPTIEVEGEISDSQSVTVKIDGVAVEVDGPLEAGQALRLDYQNVDFGIWDGETKVASVVNRMSRFDMLTMPTSAVPVSVQSTGTLSTIRVDANSRRV